MSPEFPPGIPPGIPCPEFHALISIVSPEFPGIRVPGIYCPEFIVSPEFVRNCPGIRILFPGIPELAIWTAQDQQSRDLGCL